jgi:hypothetical protein
MAPRRAVTVWAVAGVTLLVLLAGLATLSFDASGMGRAVLARAAAATGATLTARTFRLRPVTGLAIEGLEGSAVFTGGRATIEVERVVLDHRLWRLLLGEVAVDRLVVRRPRIRLVETRAQGPAPRRPGAAGAASLGRLVLRLARIDVEDGRIELQALGAPRPVVMTGLEVALRDIAFDARKGASLAGLSGRGQVNVREVAFARTTARDVRGALEAGEGRLAASAVSFQTPYGPFEGTLDARLDRLPFAYTLSLRGDPLDMSSVLAVSGRSGRGPGAGTLRLEGRGAGVEAAGLTGKGVLRLAGGELPATPLLAAVERALGRTQLVGARYEPTEAPFRVEGGRVYLDRLRLSAGPMGLDIGGWASLEGPLDLGVDVTTKREGLTVDGIAAGALDLLTDDQGRVVIPLRVTGTQEQPRVRPDAAALAEHARRGGTRALMDEAGRRLEGLLGGKERPR